MTGTWIGIDAGASGIKVAAESHGQREYRRLPRHDLAALGAFVRKIKPLGIGTTGGGGLVLGEHFHEIRSCSISEIEAWAAGATDLAHAQDIALTSPRLVVSLGTGTSVLLIQRDATRRVGGCALGGGTWLGLGQLLLGTGEHQTLAQLAREGNRQQVDLHIHEIYPDVPPGFTAANFGSEVTRAGQTHPPEDLAHALAVMLRENISLLCCALAETHDTRQILYGGGLLRDNPRFWEAIERTAEARSFEAHGLSSGEFAGAVGALLASQKGL